MVKTKTTNGKSSTSISSRTSSKKVIGASVLVGLVGLAGFGIGQAVQDKPNADSPASFTPVYSISQTELNSAKNLLGRLLVADSQAQDLPDYDSKAMPSWIDTDNDGCETRYDVLERDLLNGKADAKNCQIKSGTFLIIILAI